MCQFFLFGFVTVGNVYTFKYMPTYLILLFLACLFYSNYYANLILGHKLHISKSGTYY
jgi:hypothetical protein